MYQRLNILPYRLPYLDCRTSHGYLLHLNITSTTRDNLHLLYIRPLHTAPFPRRRYRPQDLLHQLTVTCQGL